MKTSAQQDYLKAVYTLSETLGRVTTSALSEHLGVRPSSVTAMVKKLSAARPRLLDYKSHRGVALTKVGRRIALDMTRRHRLIEQFLVVILGFAWEEVHDEAERLEHCVSDAFIDRLDARLGYPTRDPHGRPIPSKSGEIQAVEEIRLSDVPLNETVRVSSVGSEEPEFLKFLSDIGLKPNVVVKVSEIAKAGNTILVDLSGGGDVRQRVISSALAEKIFVTHDP
jgi:DtxR family Mn-dependent transcriptional regulator